MTWTPPSPPDPNQSGQGAMVLPPGWQQRRQRVFQQIPVVQRAEFSRVAQRRERIFQKLAEAYNDPDQRAAATDAALAELSTFSDPTDPNTPLLSRLAEPGNNGTGGSGGSGGSSGSGTSGSGSGSSSGSGGVESRRYIPWVSRRLTVKERKFLTYVFVRALNPDNNQPLEANQPLYVAIASVFAKITLSNFHAMGPGHVVDPEYIAAANAIDRQGKAAITLGTDVYFGGRYFPQPNAKLWLTGHEAFHALHGELMGMGQNAWLLGYVTDTGLQGLFGGDPYEGNVSEVFGYAMEQTIKDLLNKYRNLIDEVSNGQADARHPNIRQEIRTTFMRYLLERDLKYRRSLWNWLPRWMR